MQFKKDENLHYYNEINGEEKVNTSYFNIREQSEAVNESG